VNKDKWAEMRSEIRERWRHLCWRAGLIGHKHDWEKTGIMTRAHTEWECDLCGADKVTRTTDVDRMYLKRQDAMRRHGVNINE